MNLTLFSIFSAGFLTFFTPCVLPIIPIYFIALAGGSMANVQKNRFSMFLKGLAFTVGFIFVFSILGSVASSIGGILKSYQNQIMLAGGILILLFGLKFAHIIQIPFFDKTIRVDDSKLKTKFPFINAFLMGVFFAGGWSPCIGPILGSVLTYTASTTSNPLTGFFYLFIYSSGFAIPFLIAAIFAEQGMAMLRKFNRYLPVFEKITGIFLVGMAIYVISGAVQTPQPNIIVKKELNKTQENIIKSKNNLPVMIEFYSKDCHVCKKMAPIVDSIFEKCQGNKVELKKIDVSENKNKFFLKKYGIIGVPTFILFNNKGIETARLVGKQTEDSLYQALSVLRGESCEGFRTLKELEQDFSSGDTCSPTAKSCGE